jgi:hypothetical protein
MVVQRKSESIVGRLALGDPLAQSLTGSGSETGKSQKARSFGLDARLLSPELRQLSLAADGVTIAVNPHVNAVPDGHAAAIDEIASAPTDRSPEPAR